MSILGVEMKICDLIAETFNTPYEYGIRPARMGVKEPPFNTPYEYRLDI